MAIAGFLCAQTQEPAFNPRNLSKKPGPLTWAGVLPVYLHEPAYIQSVCTLSVYIRPVSIWSVCTQPTCTCPVFYSQAAMYLGFLTLTAGEAEMFLRGEDSFGPKLVPRGKKEGKVAGAL